MLRHGTFARDFAGALLAVAMCGADAQPMHETRLPGGGSIGLPAGWRIEPGAPDMVSASGPQGRVDLGIYAPMYTPEAARDVAKYGISAPAVGPYNDPGQAMINILEATNIVKPRSIHIVERNRTRNWNGPGEDLAFTISTTDAECVGTVLHSATGPGQFMYYQSTVCAPRAQFARYLPTLLRIWASWHIGDGIYQQRLADTVANLRTSTEIMNGVARRRGLAGERYAQIWDKVIKGCLYPYYHPDSPWCEIPPDDH